MLCTWRWDRLSLSSLHKCWLWRTERKQSLTLPQRAVEPWHWICTPAHSQLAMRLCLTLRVSCALTVPQTSSWWWWWHFTECKYIYPCCNSMLIALERPQSSSWLFFLSLTVHAGYACVTIIHRTLTWTERSLLCAQMLMHAITHGGVQTPK